MLNKLLTLALVGVLTLYAATGLFMRYQADDYCQAVDVQQAGVAGFTVDQYQTWQGRYSYVFLMSAFYALLGTSAPAITPPLLIAALVMSIWWASKPFAAYPALLACGLTVAFIGSLPNQWQSLYWMSASLNYITPIVSFTLLLGWLARWRWLGSVSRLEWLSP